MKIVVQVFSAIRMRVSLLTFTEHLRGKNGFSIANIPKFETKTVIFIGVMESWGMLSTTWPKIRMFCHQIFRATIASTLFDQTEN